MSLNDFNTALNRIASGGLRQVYFLSGQERYLIRKAEKAIINAALKDDEQNSNFSLFHGDPDLKELIAAIEATSFFDDKNLVIVRESALFKAGSKPEAAVRETKPAPPLERLATLLENMPTGSHIIFTSSQKPDKRKKLYKIIEKSGVIIEAEALKGRELREWLYSRLDELDLKMQPEAKEYLLAAVNLMPQVSLDFLDNELEKIVLYTGGKHSVALDELKEILAKVPEVSVFAMIEALAQKDLPLALRLYKEQVSSGKHPIQVIALLARQSRQLLQIKDLSKKGFGARQIADYSKLPLFVAEKLERQSRMFSKNKLEQSIVNLSAADHMLKSGRSGQYVLEQIMIELCL